ncbi:TAPETUM DETERMINANT 1 [Spatholobus suberectus]|nr:TAPETUM DETERMINANT 1 [Spatholobus suberectus]
MSGYSQCSLRDLSISQFRTGVRVQGKPEWSVTIANKCPCVQKNVILNCKGFQSVEHINPSLLRVSHNVCLVNGGQSIYGNVVKFTYVWDQAFPLNPISSEISCS